MRIGVDARATTDHRGPGRYLRSLLRTLAQIDKKNTYFLFYEKGQLDSFILDQANFIKKPFSSDTPERFRDIFFREHFRLPGELRRYKLDLLFQPNNYLFFLGPGKIVVTLHDLKFLVLPELLKALSFKERIISRMILSMIKRKASKVITISEHTREAAIRYLRLSPGRVVAIPHGISPDFQPIRDERILKRVRERYNLGRDFILYLGGVNPWKNLESLIHAYSQVINEVNSPELIIAGEIEKDYSISSFPRIKRMIADYKISHRIRFLGFIPDEDLPGLYNLAKFFVFPSLYEGFGFPVLEAMACGCPVISSRATSLPEVVGEGALLFNPRDPGELVRAMKRVLTDRSLRTELREKGLSRASKFSWLKCAQETLKVFEELG